MVSANSDIYIENRVYVCKMYKTYMLVKFRDEAGRAGSSIACHVGLHKIGWFVHLTV